MLVFATEVMNVIVTARREKEETEMKTFTIDIDNNISAFATAEEAAAAITAPFEPFTSQNELTALAAKWPAERLVEIWNSLAGVKPVKSLKSLKIAAGRIWERIQGLGEVPKPKAEAKAKGGAAVAKGAPAKSKATKKPPRQRKRPKPRRARRRRKAPARARAARPLRL